MKNIPERIFIQIGDDCPKDIDYSELCGLTFSDNGRVFQNDLEYVLVFENSHLLERAVRKWGPFSQIDKLQEETQELALALHQYKCSTKNKDEGMDRIIDEIADVKIMLAQADLIFDPIKIRDRVQVKLGKLEQYLNIEEKPKS